MDGIDTTTTIQAQINLLKTDDTSVNNQLLSIESDIANLQSKTTAESYASGTTSFAGNIYATGNISTATISSGEFNTLNNINTATTIQSQLDGLQTQISSSGSSNDASFNVIYNQLTTLNNKTTDISYNLISSINKSTTAISSPYVQSFFNNQGVKILLANMYTNQFGYLTGNLSSGKGECDFVNTNYSKYNQNNAAYSFIKCADASNNYVTLFQVNNNGNFVTKSGTNIPYTSLDYISTLSSNAQTQLTGLQTKTQNIGANSAYYQTGDTLNLTGGSYFATTTDMYGHGGIGFYSYSNPYMQIMLSVMTASSASELIGWLECKGSLQIDHDFQVNGTITNTALQALEYNVSGITYDGYHTQMSHLQCYENANCPVFEVYCPSSRGSIDFERDTSTSTNPKCHISYIYGSDRPQFQGDLYFQCNNVQLSDNFMNTPAVYFSGITDNIQSQFDIISDTTCPGLQSQINNINATLAPISIASPSVRNETDISGNLLVTNNFIVGTTKTNSIVYQTTATPGYYTSSPVTGLALTSSYQKALDLNIVGGTYLSNVNVYFTFDLQQIFSNYVGLTSFFVSNPAYNVKDTATITSLTCQLRNSNGTVINTVTLTGLTKATSYNCVTPPSSYSGYVYNANYGYTFTQNVNLFDNSSGYYLDIDDQLSVYIKGTVTYINPTTITDAANNFSCTDT